MQATFAIIKTRQLGRIVANDSRRFSKFQKLRSSNKVLSRRKVAKSKGDRAKARLLNRPRVRQYDPSTGRWLSKDPDLFKAGGFDTNQYVAMLQDPSYYKSGNWEKMETNLYGYTFSDPINFVDSNGRYPAPPPGSYGPTPPPPTSILPPHCIAAGCSGMNMGFTYACYILPPSPQKVGACMAVELVGAVCGWFWVNGL